MPRLARQVQAERLTYLTDEKFLSLADELARIERERIAGDFYEFGVALGGSAIFIGSRLGPGRRFRGYDVFGMIPAPSARDSDDTHARYKIIAEGKSAGIGKDEYYGYVDNLYDRVVGTFEKFGLKVDGDRISLKKGLFEDTLQIGSRERVALAHIDCDWFDPVHFCVSNVSPRLSVGGVLIIDDYNDYEGCRQAVDWYLKTDGTLKLARTSPHAVLRKVRGE